MSSANNKNNGSLEDSFRRRMQDAEATPAPDIWSRIDHDLTVQENIQYKKRIVFYRQLAAACFVLFIMAGSILIYHFNAIEGSVDNIANQKQGKAGTPGFVQSAKSAEKGNNIINNSTSSSGHSANTALASANADQRKGSGSEEYKGEIPASRQNKIVQHTASSKINVATIAKGESKNAASDLTSTLSLLNSTETEPVSGMPGEQSKQPVQDLSRTSVVSLMAKDPQKPGAFALDSKVEAQKQAVALAQELNADLKGNKGTDNTSGNSRWSMSLAYVPTYFAQNIGVPDPLTATSKNPTIYSKTLTFSKESSANMVKAREEYENNAMPVYSYAVDLKTGFKLGKKTKLTAGIGFSQNTARINTNYIVEQIRTGHQIFRAAPLPPTTVFLSSLSSGFTADSISVSQTDAFNVDHRYRMVSLPIGLQFEDGITRGWSWYVAGGVAANLLFESKIISSKQDIADVTYNNQDDSPYRDTQFSGNIGLGVSKQVTGAVSVALGPEFRGFFNTMLSDSDNYQAPQGKPYAIGMNMSLNYQLGR